MPETLPLIQPEV